ncbi:PepSY domain-containing protein [Lampropedia puyangensis]|uniref:PepSY domain-containing protein n=2 Tax=Lampropedia puyangensis TaxID=1330072 RepID=A0A4V4GRV5_9BURK|nr:PepSY domain-containing protein [Lampropedia puyangensis]
MTPLHTWLGLLAGWLLYAMFLTGTVSFFKEEISQWMRPELPFTPTANYSGVADRVAQTLAQQAPTATQWSISLPTQRHPIASAYWRTPEGGRRGFNSGDFDPQTGEQLERHARATRGGDFFYRFHFQLHYMPVMWGRWLAGLAGMFMLVAIITGVIIHKKIFIDFFTFRWGKGQRSWWDAHNLLSVFGLPFHAMITYTGLVTLMLMYMPWGSDAAFRNAEERQALNSKMYLFNDPQPAAGQAAPMVSLQTMIAQGEAMWGPDSVSRVSIDNPGDANARVYVLRSDIQRPNISPHWLQFDGVTGHLLAQQNGVGAAAETRGVLYALHLGRFGDVATRWLYFLSSLAGTAMVGTGLVLWTVKRRARLPDPSKPYFGFRLVERLNIGTIAGLSCGMATMLWANRLLPVELKTRATWEVDVMFIVWAVVALWCFVRPVKKAWLESLGLAVVMLAGLPIVNALTTERGLVTSLFAGDWVFAGLDLTLLALAALHAMLWWRVQRYVPKSATPKKAKPSASHASHKAAPSVASATDAATAATPVAHSSHDQAL